MAYYVMLNFEDADPNAGAGAGKAKALTIKDVAKAKTIGSAAAGTARIYSNRAIKRSSFFKTKEVAYYSCQEILGRHQNKALAQTDLANIQKDCKSAKTIAFIIHGTPTDTDNGFGTDGKNLCTWKELGELALLLLPSGQEYNIALIMCYAARSQQADLDHNGQIPVNELKSSFAYKFYRSICTHRTIRMSARTGAVSNDAGLNHTVETEEEVMLLLKKQEAKQLRALNKADMDDQKNKLLARKGLSEKDFAGEMAKFTANANHIPNGEVETFAKSYMIYSSQVNYYIQNQFDQTKLGNRSKYGKLVYDYDGSFLSIISRYDAGILGPNYSLYHGPLL